jgi:hypothetical protein
VRLLNPRFLVLAVTIFLSAFLLFQVQPLIAKYILPWFGGGSGVWSVALAFFQFVLLGGYGYAHLLNSRLKPKAQVIVHGVLLLVACVVLPIIPGDWLKPAPDDDPMLRILLLLFVTVGLPYFMLSATGPLLQAWFSRGFPGRSPYPLYALSNVGSLLALLSYPFIVEPLLGRYLQATSWSVGFGVFVTLCLVTGAVSLLKPAEPAPAPPDPAPPAPEPTPAASPAEPASIRELAAAEKAAEEAADLARRAAREPVALWILLPACATMMLLSFTSQLCIDVASIPFLWVLPLSLYLITFIFTFAGERWYPRKVFLALMALAGPLSAAAFHWHADFSLALAIPGYLLLMFVLIAVCHGEVYRLRPAPQKLTKFYFCISLGGAIGGSLTAFVAPLAFPLHLEFHVAILLAMLLVLTGHGKDPGSFLFRGRAPMAWSLLILMVLTTLGLSVWGVYALTSKLLYVERNFYGVFRVEEAADEGAVPVRTLVSGSTIHGWQYMHREHLLRPTSYFGLNSGAGIALTSGDEGKARRVGVIGLGVGTLAAYGRPGDHFKFYEINPVSRDVAEEYFYYLRGSEATHEVVVGDGRLLLEAEAPQGFDVLVVDAFTSDSIPTHLLTTEAFALYVKHLKPDGVILLNITNRHLDLRPVVRQSALAHGLSFAGWQCPANLKAGTAASMWMICTRSAAFMAAFGKNLEQMQKEWPREGADDNGLWPRTLGMPLDVYGGPEIEPWTDDYSNLFQLFK